MKLVFFLFLYQGKHGVTIQVWRHVDQDAGINR